MSSGANSGCWSGGGEVAPARGIAAGDSAPRGALLAEAPCVQPGLAAALGFVTAACAVPARVAKS